MLVKMEINYKTMGPGYRIMSKVIGFLEKITLNHKTLNMLCSKYLLIKQES